MGGDFVIGDREYPRLPELLAEVAPSFAGSAEFRRLDPADHELPSVVAGAFARYVERLNTYASGTLPATDKEIADAFRAIERLASSADPDVVNTLVVEVFEHLDLPEADFGRFYARLGPSARGVHDEWIGAPPR